MATQPISRADRIDTNLVFGRDDSDLPLHPTTPGAGSNWLWLAQLSQWNATLELDTDTPRIAADLQRHFADVRFHAIQLDTALPFADATFDCVTLNGALERLLVATGAQPVTLLRRLFAECRRLLRAGGCLYVGTGTLEPERARSRWRTIAGWRRPLILDRLLRQAGFTSVHSYWVDPCLDRPYVIIPATQQSLLAREHALAKSGAADFRRIVAVRLGLAQALYPARIRLAYT